MKIYRTLCFFAASSGFFTANVAAQEPGDLPGTTPGPGGVPGSLAPKRSKPTFNAILSSKDPCSPNSMCGATKPHLLPFPTLTFIPMHPPTTGASATFPIPLTVSLGGQPVAVTNACHQKIRFALSYMKDNKWQNAGWWNITPGRTTVLSSKAHGKIQTPHDHIFIYAASSDHKWAGNQMEKIGNTIVPMMKVNAQRDADDDWRLALFCPPEALVRVSGPAPSSTSQ